MPITSLHIKDEIGESRVK